MSWHPGATLQQKLDSGQHFSVADVAGIGLRLAKGLGALHRLNIVHRDIKPANLHQGDDGKLRILDLGVATSAVTGARDHAAIPARPASWRRNCLPVKPPTPRATSTPPASRSITC